MRTKVQLPTGFLHPHMRLCEAHESCKRQHDSAAAAARRRAVSAGAAMLDVDRQGRCQKASKPARAAHARALVTPRKLQRVRYSDSVRSQAAAVFMLERTARSACDRPRRRPRRLRTPCACLSKQRQARPAVRPEKARPPRERLQGAACDAARLRPQDSVESAPWRAVTQACTQPFAPSVRWPSAS